MPFVSRYVDGFGEKRNYILVTIMIIIKIQNNTKIWQWFCFADKLLTIQLTASQVVDWIHSWTGWFVE